MDEITVLSRTQRVIVGANASVRVVNAGPIGPPGLRGQPGPGSAGSSATGTQDVPQLVWVINHDLQFFPAGVKFFDVTGEEELEPEDLTYVNNNRILATWPEPTAGTWMIS